jgi:hypothetical protein
MLIIVLYYNNKYDKIISDEQMREAYLFYTELNNKNEIRFQYYIECSSTYGEGTYFNWSPMSLNLFLEKIENLNVKSFQE